VLLLPPGDGGRQGEGALGRGEEHGVRGGEEVLPRLLRPSLYEVYLYVYVYVYVYVYHAHAYVYDVYDG